jgi:hypothetical protein
MQVIVNPGANKRILITTVLRVAEPAHAVDQEGRMQVPASFQYQKATSVEHAITLLV